MVLEVLIKNIEVPKIRDLKKIPENTPNIRGSSPSLPANIFFLWRETFNFEAAKTPKKTDRRRTK
jgi:hypothetical protein